MSTDRRRDDEKEIQILSDELLLKESEYRELEQKITRLENQNDDLREELSRVKRLQAQTELDLRKMFKKYDNVLDEMRMSPNRLEKELAFYHQRSDDLEDNLQDQRSMWRKTNMLLTKENEKYQRQNQDLLFELETCKEELIEERKKCRTLEEEIDLLTLAKEDAEKAYREQELKTAKILNEHAMKVEDLYITQAKYMKQFRRKNSLSDEKELTDSCSTSYLDDNKPPKSLSDNVSCSSDYVFNRRDDRFDTFCSRGRLPSPKWDDRDR